MNPEPTGMTCGFPGCHVKLNMLVREYKDGRRETDWIHAITPEDVPYHDAIPVPVAELSPTAICDFCGDLNPEWVLGCPETQEQYRRTSDGAEIETISQAGWAACRECKELLDEGDIGALTDRAVMASELRGQLSRVNRADRRKIRPQLWRDMHAIHTNFVRLRTYDDYPLIDAIDKQRQRDAIRGLFP